MHVCRRLCATATLRRRSRLARQLHKVEIAQVSVRVAPRRWQRPSEASPFFEAGTSFECMAFRTRYSPDAGDARFEHL